jgi:hypothetical protein
MKRYVRRFSAIGDSLFPEKIDKDVNKTLKSRGATAEDIVSITYYRSGPSQVYTIWYKSER